MKDYIPKVYYSFEDFERDELHADAHFGHSVEKLMTEHAVEELDFDIDAKKRRDEEEDEEVE